MSAASFPTLLHPFPGNGGTAASQPWELAFRGKRLVLPQRWLMTLCRSCRRNLGISEGRRVLSSALLVWQDVLADLSPDPAVGSSTSLLHLPCPRASFGQAGREASRPWHHGRA